MSVKYQDNIANHLVAGRECGDCTVCCSKFIISEPDMQKPSNYPCKYLNAERGCGIYENRPSVCASYYCYWRAADFLDDSFRPDKSGLLITTTNYEKIPPEYPPVGLVFNPVKSPDILMHPGVLEMIADFMITKNIPIFVTIGFEKGRVPHTRFLNNRIKFSDRETAMPVLRQLMQVTIDSCLEGLRDNPQDEKIEHAVHRPLD